jgi:hypothetical protein
MTVTADDVERLLPETELSPTALNAFIEPAGRMYDDLVSGYDVNPDIRDDVVERLAAHLIATGPERQLSSAGEGGGNVSFEGETGEGLRASTHGQIAITLDPTGQLASRDKPGASVSSPTTKRGDRRR